MVAYEQPRPGWIVRLVGSSLTVLLIVVYAPSRHLGAKAEPRHIDLVNYRLTFSEDFRGPLEVTPWGPSRWIAHTPWNGDFGDARFANPARDFPFFTGAEGLEIIARKRSDGKWESGLLSTRDPRDAGFKQAGGYFETRMKFPVGPGTWPAFWLVARGDPEYDAEIDVVEYYGHFNDGYHVNLHLWPTRKSLRPQTQGAIVSVPANSLSSDYHVYGVEISESEIVFYLDRREVKAFPTLSPMKYPMSILLDLALGSGWPIDKTVDPSILRVDYVRAYLRK
jgi:beta-glucanase (GH16 family)